MHLEVIESFVKLKQLQTDRLLPTFFLFMDSIIFRHEIEGYTAKEECENICMLISFKIKLHFSCQWNVKKQALEKIE